MVLPTFAGQALRGAPITVFGDGTQTRCFAHVSDVIGALDRLCQTESAFGEVFNIGNDEEISMLELARKVRQIAASSSEIQLIPYEQAYEAGFEDMPRRVPDLSKIKSAINYQPKKSIDDIVISVVDSLRAK
jgi:UDP-glucose 4-epimerase